MNDSIINIIYTALKWMMGILGALLALLEPTIPYILICTIAVLLDCYTAWALSRRVKAKFPGANDGKFKSHYAGRVFLTLVKVYALTVLAYLIDIFIFPDFKLLLPNMIAGAVCFWQIWSMLENESSCNDARWAILAQRILVDKTERHFDIDLHELKPNDVAGVDDSVDPVIDICGHMNCGYRRICNPDNAKKCPGRTLPRKTENHG